MMNGLDSSASLGMTFGGSGCGEWRVGRGRQGLCMNGLDSSASLGMTFGWSEWHLGVGNDVWGGRNGSGERIWRMLGGIVVDHDSGNARRTKWGSWMAKSQL